MHYLTSSFNINCIMYNWRYEYGVSVTEPSAGLGPVVSLALSLSLSSLSSLHFLPCSRRLAGWQYLGSAELSQCLRSSSQPSQTKPII